MNMNKSLTAVAVAGALTVPMSAAQAQPEGWYGFIAAGVEVASVDDDFTGGGGGFPIFATATDDSIALADIAESRFGFGGSEDLGGGLSGTYQFEFGLSTSAFPGAGSTNQTANVRNRLSNVGLAGDFGSITIGQQWGTLYNYLGWNIFKSSGHGGGAWYYMTGLLSSNAYGLRASNAINYTYGAGSYGTDPFTFTVEAQIGDRTGPNADAIDSLVLAGQGTFGDVQVQGLFLQENAVDAAGDQDPSLFGVGASWNSGMGLGVHGTLMQMDMDTAAGENDEPFSVEVLVTGDFGGGLSGMAGFGTVDGDDGIDDLDANLFLQLRYAMSSRTALEFEFENVSFDNTGDASIFYAGVKHDF